MKAEGRGAFAEAFSRVIHEIEIACRRPKWPREPPQGRYWGLDNGILPLGRVPGRLRRRRAYPDGWHPSRTLLGPFSGTLLGFLCRRHKLRVSGTSRFGYAEVFGKAGVIDIHRRRLQRSPVHALL
jgi:hypothetical protein